jgi:hypothetical protein
MNLLVKRVYEAFLIGDSISDEDLLDAIPNFEELFDNLVAMGPTMNLASNEVGRVLRGLREFKAARANKEN